MKARGLFIYAVTLLVTFDSVSYCQKIDTIADFGERAEKLWEVQLPITPHPQRGLASSDYAILKSGVVVLSSDGKTISCYDFNNQLKWQKPAFQGYVLGIEASPYGEYLSLYSPHHEDEGTTAVWNAEGELLWSATYGGPLKISHSGKYLISQYDWLDQSVPMMVLDLATGRTLWQVDLAPPHLYWQAAAGQNDKLAYYNGGKLKLFEMETGKAIWEKPIEFDPREDLGQVHISLMGNVVSYNCSIVTGNFNQLQPDSKSVTYIFDENGDILWLRTKAAVPGKSDGGGVEGISDDGEYIAFRDGTYFSLCATRSHKELWTINAGLNMITSFTKNFLAFYPNTDNETTTLITLKEDGSIRNHYTLNEFIDFSRQKRGSSSFREQQVTGNTSIVVKKIDEKLILSMFTLKF